MLNFLPALILLILSGPIQSEASYSVARGEMIRFVLIAESQELFQLCSDAPRPTLAPKQAVRRVRQGRPVQPFYQEKAATTEAENPRDGPF